ncbi:MAG TPA: transglycosylase SLT domain-containing protein, partial [Saliniramus sp.]|nr:transglycosylase SLT domain-containing protein [Saliniramus sp.]
MFLFTTPNAPQSASANPVVDAIRQGAKASGTEFEYLLNTAQRESSLDPSAIERTSSATGLFQFIEQTWLAMVKKDGASLGLSEQAQQIAQRPDGSFAVADPAARREILALREDPEIASSVAGAFTQRNRDMLANGLGREPRSSDLYIAHFLGAGGALELIRQASANPQASAADIFPEAARANRSIFYDRAGTPRGAGEVYGLLASYHASTIPTAPAGDAAGTDSQPFALAKTDGPAFHGLFQTGGRPGAISESVSQLWGVQPRDQEASTPAVRFFPGAPGNGRAPVAEAVEDAAASMGASALQPPLPPERPGIAASPARGYVPLDITKFMNWRR